MEKLSAQAPNLRELQRTATQLLTDDLCEKHEPVKTLKEQCDQLEPKWEELQGRIDGKLGELEKRVSFECIWVCSVCMSSPGLLSLFSFSLSLSLSSPLLSSPLLSSTFSLPPSFPLPFLSPFFSPRSHTQHDQWRSDAIESIKKYMEVRLQLDELRDEKDSEIRELKYRLDHRPHATPRRQASSRCPCNGWKIACVILLVMVVLLVLVLAAVITLQVVDPEIRPI